MIPKIIHYCWFGGKPLPKLAQKCISSWKKYCPDYQMIRWDESNFDYHKMRYTAEAYQAQKWAFVSDVARLDAVYRYGGFYLDTDVELLQPLESFRNHACFMGLEQNGCVNTGLGFGAEKGNDVVAANYALYEDLPFLRNDGTYNLAPCVYYTTLCLEEYGPIRRDTIQTMGSVTVYPAAYFCPSLRSDGKAEILPQTVSVHWYDASWYTQKEKRIVWRARFAYTYFGKPGKCIYDGFRILETQGPCALWERIRKRFQNSERKT